LFPYLTTDVLPGLHFEELFLRIPEFGIKNRNSETWSTPSGSSKNNQFFSISDYYVYPGYILENFFKRGAEKLGNSGVNDSTL
jgi:hypothetical protein